MGKVLIFLAILTLILAGNFVFKSNNKTNCSSSKASALVLMENDKANPDKLTIKRCTKVSFRNNSQRAVWPASDLHPTHGIYPEFDPKQGIDPGREWSFVFDKVGNWRYHDHLAPQIRGVIIVKED